MTDKEKQAAILAGKAAPKESNQSALYENLDDLASKIEEKIDTDAVKRAFEQTIPQSTMDFGKVGNEPIFSLCRKLKGIMPDLPSDELLSMLDPLFRNWFRRAESVFKSANHGVESYEDFVIQVTYILDGNKVKCPNLDCIQTAMDNATKWYQSPRPEMAWCQDRKILYLAAVCFELQALLGERAFWLSQYDAEKICGKQARQCGYVLNNLCSRKILLKTKSGDRHLGGKANEYRYIGTDIGEQAGLPDLPPGATPTEPPEITDLRA